MLVFRFRLHRFRDGQHSRAQRPAATAVRR
jgi:hypothetical protein